MEQSVWPGWKTVQTLGAGSYGKVYEIERQVFGRTEKAALKVITIPHNPNDIDELYGEGYDDESITQQFRSYLEDIIAEYALMAELKGHTNIVYCDDLHYVQHEGGLGWDICIKMELLTPLMKTLPKEIPESMVLNIGKDICRALMLCQSRNIIHRDIKPQNIFVSKDGDYKLGDFGIAKTAEKTMGGTKIGTYKYMAPEVYNNQPYGSSADLYSLGMVLYWLLNKRRMPFIPLPPALPTANDEEQSRYRRFRGEEIPAPATGSPELKRIVLKALAFRPADRYASAEQMMADLQALDSPRSANTAAAAEHTAPAGKDTESIPGDAAGSAPLAGQTPAPETPSFASGSETQTVFSKSRAAKARRSSAVPAADAYQDTDSQTELERITSEERTPDRIGPTATKDVPVAVHKAVAEAHKSVRSDPAKEPRPKRRNKRWLIPTAAALAVAAVIAVILLLSSGASDKQDNAVKVSDSSTSVADDEQDVQYRQALELLEQGDWETAKATFLALGDYSDAASMADQCDVSHVKQLLDSGDFDEAKEIALSLGGRMNDIISVYEFVYDDNSWLEAEKAAAAKGGHLACFETQDEYDQFCAILNEYGATDAGYHIGARREEDSEAYFWVDADLNPSGDALNGEAAWCNGNWLTGEPTFGWGGDPETAVELFYSGNEDRWVWNDIPEQTRRSTVNHAQNAYVIEYEQSSLVFECDYQKAISILEEGDLETARELFMKLGTYSDAPLKVKECDYQSAQALMDAQEYEKAGDIFASLSYRDSSREAMHCYVFVVRNLAKESRIVDLAAFLFKHKDMLTASYYYSDCDVGLMRYKDSYTKDNEYEYLIDYYFQKGNDVYTYNVFCYILDANGNIKFFGVYNKADGYNEYSISAFNWDKVLQDLGYAS